MGLKNSDAKVAFLCNHCHYEIDNGKSMTKDQRRAEMDAAIVGTLSWLIENGYLVISDK